MFNRKSQLIANIMDWERNFHAKLVISGIEIIMKDVENKKIILKKIKTLELKCKTNMYYKI